MGLPGSVINAPHPRAGEDEGERHHRKAEVADGDVAVADGDDDGEQMERGNRGRYPGLPADEEQAADGDFKKAVEQDERSEVNGNEGRGPRRDVADPGVRMEQLVNAEPQEDEGKGDADDGGGISCPLLNPSGDGGHVFGYHSDQRLMLLYVSPGDNAIGLCQDCIPSFVYSGSATIYS